MKQLNYFRSIVQLHSNCIETIKALAPRVDTETANKAVLMAIKISGGLALGVVVIGMTSTIGGIMNDRYKSETDRLRALRGL